MIFIYTDGSCLGNPGFGGWAAIMNNGGVETVLAGTERDTTNNRMEVLAAIKALEALDTHEEVTIVSDSRYLVNTMSKGWKRKANQDLWADLDILAKGRVIHWEWVQGHNGDVNNERVDKIANDNDVFVIEDCCQGLGSLYLNSPVGSFGDISCFSFYPSKNMTVAGDGGMIGIFPFIIQQAQLGMLFDWAGFMDVFFRSNQLPSIFGLLLTVGVLLILVYTQGMKVEIPIVSTKYRGFAATYPIKLMYVSNIPVILASALTANAVFMGQMLWSQLNPRNASPFFNILGQFDPTSPSTPIGGIVYYITPPRGLDLVALDPMRGVLYVLFMIGIVVIFGKLWVELGGLSSKKAAQNLLDADVVIPGFRRSNKPVEMLLNKYIPSVTILGSVILGLIAGVSDILGVFGSGIGVLLTVDILINYYNQLVREKVEVVMPRLGAWLGR